MNPVIEKIITTFKEMSMVRKVLIGGLALVVVAGFITMFVWANQTPYKAAYSELSQEDAAAVVEILKSSNTPYRLTGDGTTILVPDTMVYDIRLTMAKEGIPKGAGVGYEIFDKSEFGTTEFVQKINKKRALQGELARTIAAFEAVKDAKVMIVLPKESVFVEETKQPSASILLELVADLQKDEVAAIAHLVASSVQDLTPKLVTIVDTAGRILFEGKSEEEEARINAENLADAQYQYKVRFEENLTRRLQTMLERIVGANKAIVRVTSEMDFSKNNMNEEIYDPFERGGEFIRSRKNRAEKVVQLDEQVGIPSSVNPITDEDQAGDKNRELINKSDDTVNYEISRRTRETQKPMAELTRLSVAAVIDGKYEFQTGDNGDTKRVYMPRSAEEMQQFQSIVTRAMGYNEERNDQVSMECFPFASIDDMQGTQERLTGWRMVQKEYGRLIANLLLVFVLFLFIIRPIIKTVRDIKVTVEQEALPSPEERAQLETEEKEPAFIEMNANQQREFFEMMTEDQKEEFIQKMTAAERNAYIANMSSHEKARYYAEKDLFKTVNIIKGWLSDVEEEEEED
ncbi:flagellar M-ring protein FliF [Desulfobacter hydrogenophilus]|uniref:Flagellar M-ring protein n=1 Tax=Desulfobacter hydrogenophilus TaxID=2291 RepID=A0A328FL21_9BACT|nr:flagellar basal-body MS-ring/collar protein FliF [Desulfobacter hydrogenophilus]NDY73395.1 flagellar M-ring protein FliF [Desulfobacter hydrogenophilus]QBH12949.1 flagellar M-ring protein FliF [Desulfobacter hydrogenophilus]RAM03933.1 flagellar M-ring protein FliF [Desulfobacter hydrogenophilus]